MLQEPASFGEFLLDDRLVEISTPVELVWGESDRLMSIEYAERMLAELPRARLTRVPTCGHIPQAECPERFVETLLSVLETDPPPRPIVETSPEEAPADPEEKGDAAR